MGTSDPAVPPRALVLLADWSNILAGLTLTVSFSTIAAALTFHAIELTGVAHTVVQFTMTAEGILWAVGGAALAKINLIVNNASLAVGQTIICFGGIFFAISGFGDGVPAKIISLKYVLPFGEQAHGTLADAAPLYGIACFMVATAMGLRGVWPLPKNRLVSPFAGVACFFLGAWTIGVLGLWGPCLADGLLDYRDVPGSKVFALPPYAWGWIHVFQVIGALFLTAGGIIFGVMDGLFGGERRRLALAAGRRRPMAAECGPPEGTEVGVQG